MITPDRVAGVIARWVRWYTRDLPPPIAGRRIDEIDGDVQDHIAHERILGASDRRIALGILSRMVRGLPADASWRGRHARAASARRPGTLRSARRVVLVTAVILMVPLVAMQFTDQVAWGVFDFVVAGVLLGGTGLIHQLVRRRGGDMAYRAAFGVALAAALLLVWANLAVGIIGEPDDLANIMYFGVLAVGVGGAYRARLRPRGMARVLSAMALAQASAAVVALIAGKHQLPFSSVSDILAVNGLFIALFIASAWLFRRAARRQASANVRPLT